MKVLKPGRNQRGWSVEATCTGTGNGYGGCGAELLVEEPDLFKTYRRHRDESEEFITFKCSACGVLTDLPAKSEPPSTITNKLLDQTNWENKGGL